MDEKDTPTGSSLVSLTWNKGPPDDGGVPVGLIRLEVFRFDLLQNISRKQISSTSTPKRSKIMNTYNTLSVFHLLPI